jgi:hypothetical protein
LICEYNRVSRNQIRFFNIVLSGPNIKDPLQHNFQASIFTYVALYRSSANVEIHTPLSSRSAFVHQGNKLALLYDPALQLFWTHFTDSSRIDWLAAQWDATREKNLGRTSISLSLTMITSFSTLLCCRKVASSSLSRIQSFKARRKF